MKRKWLTGGVLAIFLAGMLLGCGQKGDSAVDAANSAEIGETEEDEESPQESQEATVRVGALKGPTSMGMVFLMDQQEDKENQYEFTMVTAADELLTQMAKGELDVALIPANTAAVLYQKTEGEIAAVDINTLGVLYVVTGDESLDSMEKLAGKTLYLTGKGTTPDYALQYLLKAYGVTDVTLEYKSEAAEVAAVLQNDPQAVGVLPQPFATVACAQNDKLKVAMDLTEVWDQIQDEGGSRLVTGVTVMTKDFLEQYPDQARQFLKDHEESTDQINEDPETGAKLVAEAGIVEQEAIARQAIPYCNITCISGGEMKTALEGYLETLYELNPESVGGAMPEEDFYFE
ncbi:MAG: ABC transporter substrate-binding protein [Ruminococcus sp.]